MLRSGFLGAKEAQEPKGRAELSQEEAGEDKENPCQGHSP